MIIIRELREINCWSRMKFKNDLIRLRRIWTIFFCKETWFQPLCIKIPGDNRMSTLRVTNSLLSIRIVSIILIRSYNCAIISFSCRNSPNAESIRWFLVNKMHRPFDDLMLVIVLLQMSKSNKSHQAFCSNKIWSSCFLNNEQNSF